LIKGKAVTGKILDIDENDGTCILKPKTGSSITGVKLAKCEKAG
jgi:hypothetical protein